MGLFSRTQPSASVEEWPQVAVDRKHDFLRLNDNTERRFTLWLRIRSARRSRARWDVYQLPSWFVISCFAESTEFFDVVFFAEVPALDPTVPAAPFTLT